MDGEPFSHALIAALQAITVGCKRCCLRRSNKSKAHASADDTSTKTHARSTVVGAKQVQTATTICGLRHLRRPVWHRAQTLYTLLAPWEGRNYAFCFSVRGAQLHEWGESCRPLTQMRGNIHRTQPRVTDPAAHLPPRHHNKLMTNGCAAKHSEDASSGPALGANSSDPEGTRGTTVALVVAASSCANWPAQHRVHHRLCDIGAHVRMVATDNALAKLHTHLTVELCFFHDHRCNVCVCVCYHPSSSSCSSSAYGPLRLPPPWGRFSPSSPQQSLIPLRGLRRAPPIGALTPGAPRGVAGFAGRGAAGSNRLPRAMGSGDPSRGPHSETPSAHGLPNRGEAASPGTDRARQIRRAAARCVSRSRRSSRNSLFLACDAWHNLPSHDVSVHAHKRASSGHLPRGRPTPAVGAKAIPRCRVAWCCASGPSSPFALHALYKSWWCA